MSEHVKAQRLIRVDVDFQGAVNVEKIGHVTRLGFGHHNAEWLVALLREVADEIEKAHGER